MDSWVTEKSRAKRKPGVSGEGEMRKRGKKEEDEVRTIEEPRERNNEE